MKRQIQ